MWECFSFSFTKSKQTYALSNPWRLLALILGSTGKTGDSVLLPPTHHVSFALSFALTSASFFLMSFTCKDLPHPLHLSTRRYQRGREEDKDSSPSPQSRALPALWCVAQWSQSTAPEFLRAPAGLRILSRPLSMHITYRKMCTTTDDNLLTLWWTDRCYSHWWFTCKVTCIVALTSGTFPASIKVVYSVLFVGGKAVLLSRKMNRLGRNSLITVICCIQFTLSLLSFPSVPFPSPLSTSPQSSSIIRPKKKIYPLSLV